VITTPVVGVKNFLEKLNIQSNTMPDAPPKKIDEPPVWLDEREPIIPVGGIPSSPSVRSVGEVKQVVTERITRAELERRQTDDLNAEFFAHLHRGGSHHYTWTADPKVTNCVPVDEPLSQVAKNNLYFGVNPTSEFIQPHQIAVVNPQKAGRQPNIYCLLDEPFVIESYDDLQHIKRIQREFVRAVGGDKSVHDLTRVLRVPGTYNTKPKYPEPRLVHYVESNMSLVYELETIQSFIMENSPVAEPMAVPSQSRQNASRATVKRSGFDEMPTIDEVRECLSYVRVPVPDSGDYEHWYNVLMAIHSVYPGADGITLCTEWSADWSPGETAKKFASFNGSGIGYGTLVYLAKQGGYRPAATGGGSQRIAADDQPVNRIDQQTIEDALAYIASFDTSDDAALRTALGVVKSFELAGTDTLTMSCRSVATKCGLSKSAVEKNLFLLSPEHRAQKLESLQWQLEKAMELSSMVHSGMSVEQLSETLPAFHSETLKELYSKAVSRLSAVKPTELTDDVIARHMIYVEKIRKNKIDSIRKRPKKIMIDIERIQNYAGPDILEMVSRDSLGSVTYRIARVCGQYRSIYSNGMYFHMYQHMSKDALIRNIPSNELRPRVVMTKCDFLRFASPDVLMAIIDQLVDSGYIHVSEYADFSTTLEAEGLTAEINRIVSLRGGALIDEREPRDYDTALCIYSADELRSELFGLIDSEARTVGGVAHLLNSEPSERRLRGQIEKEPTSQLERNMERLRVKELSPDEHISELAKSNPVLESYGATGLRIIAHLLTTGEPMKQSDLASAIGKHGNTVRVAIDRMLTVPDKKHVGKVLNPIINVEKVGRTKMITLSADWLDRLDKITKYMTTNGITQKREIQYTRETIAEIQKKLDVIVSAECQAKLQSMLDHYQRKLESLLRPGSDLPPVATPEVSETVEDDTKSVGAKECYTTLSARLDRFTAIPIPRLEGARLFHISDHPHYEEMAKICEEMAALRETYPFLCEEDDDDVDNFDYDSTKKTMAQPESYQVARRVFPTPTRAQAFADQLNTYAIYAVTVNGCTVDRRHRSGFDITHLSDEFTKIIELKK